MASVRLICCLGLLLVGAAAGGGAVLAQDGAFPMPDYSLEWFTVEGGGRAGSAGLYDVHGTFGQFDAGRLAGGAYTLTGGFWQAQGGYAAWLPLLMR